MYIPFLATIPILSTSGGHSCPGRKTEPRDRNERHNSTAVAIAKAIVCTVLDIMTVTTQSLTVQTTPAAIYRIINSVEGSNLIPSPSSCVGKGLVSLECCQGCLQSV